MLIFPVDTTGTVVGDYCAASFLLLSPYLFMLPSCFPESSIPRGSKRSLSFLPSDRDRQCKTSKPMADSLFQKADSILWWISHLPPVFYRFVAINRFVLPEP